MEDVQKDIARLHAESGEARRRLDQLDAATKRHDEDIRQLYAHQEGTKVYVTQILDSIKQLETKLFNLVTQLNTNAAEAQKNATNERTESLAGWQKTIIDVIKLTAAAAIGYLISKGGAP